MSTDERLVLDAAARRRRRRAVGSLLGLGVLTGAGITSTSAAWTDDAWFSFPASAATVDLRGSAAAQAPTDPAAWSKADTAGPGDAITLTPEAGELTPDNPLTSTVQLWNASTVPLQLSWQRSDDGASCVSVAVDLEDDHLEPSADPADDRAVTTATVTFSVRAGVDNSQGCGTSEAVHVVVQGSTVDRGGNR